MKKLFQFSLALSMLLFFSCQSKQNDIEQEAAVKYVNPFIGTAGHGHTYPGATVPFGMLQVSPVNGISAWDWCSGYNYSDSIMVGFGHLTLSGTGIGDLNDILLMPVSKPLNLTVKTTDRNKLPYKSAYSHKNEKAEAGYYQVFLEDWKVNAEVTTSKRTAYYRFTFQDEKAIQSVLVDLGFAINWDKATQSTFNIEGGGYTIYGLRAKEDHKPLKFKGNDYIITGLRYSKGWAKNQKVYFALKFSKPFTIEYIDKKVAQFTFDKGTSNEVLAKLSLSSVSIENAKANMDKEDDFDKVRKQAKTTWENALSKIQVETPTDSLKNIFYTALYHTQIAPVTFSDANGECRLQNDSIVKAKDFTVYSTLSLWDTFRAEQPLLTLLAPEKVTDIIKSMLLYYDEHKRLPVWTLYGNETNCMTGYHSIPVIVEAYQKGIRNFDSEKAYEAMKATMLQDDRGLKFYKKYGYIPYEKLDESVTISLEYAYNDWCVAQMAMALAKKDDYEFFMKRSEAYRHFFDAKTGFMRGKSVAGKWNTPFDPKRSNHREQTDYTEGNAWQHSWFVLHDVDNFIKMHGGKANFLKRLEQLFVESSEITGENVSVDISGLIGQYAHGNEPSHHIPYLFNFAEQPWRTQYWVREILKSQYNATPEGLSGNEDCGQMSAWYVFGAMGLYPFNPASGNYQIASPIFEKTTLSLANGKQFTIIAENTSNMNRYIQSATLNGKSFNQTHISHATILQGGELKFVMGATPNKNWGVKK